MARAGLISHHYWIEEGGSTSSRRRFATSGRPARPDGALAECRSESAGGWREPFTSDSDKHISLKSVSGRNRGPARRRGVGAVRLAEGAGPVRWRDAADRAGGRSGTRFPLGSRSGRANRTAVSRRRRAAGATGAARRRHRRAPRRRHRGRSLPPGRLPAGDGGAPARPGRGGAVTQTGPLPGAYSKSDLPELERRLRSASGHCAESIHACSKPIRGCSRTRTRRPSCQRSNRTSPLSITTGPDSSRRRAGRRA